MNSLPRDFCRCHDNDCPDKRNCLRFLHRDDSDLQTPHVETFREVKSQMHITEPIELTCYHQIPISEGDI